MALRAACQSSKQQIRPSVSDAFPGLRSPVSQVQPFTVSLTAGLSWVGEGRAGGSDQAGREGR